MFFLSNLSEYGRGKDKRPRKKRNMVIGAIGGTALGAGIGGYVGGKDAKRNWVRKRWYDENKLKTPEDWKIANEGSTNNVKQWEYGAKNQLPNSTSKIDRFHKKIVPLLNKVEKTSIRRGALIGSGIGLAAGLGGAYLYNKLRSNNENKR
jgi:hypothetical protein